MEYDRILMDAGSVKVYQYHTDADPVRYAFQRNNEDGTPKSRITVSRSEMQSIVRGYYPMWDDVQRGKRFILANLKDDGDLMNLLVTAFSIIGQLTFDRGFYVTGEARLRATYDDGLTPTKRNADSLNAYIDEMKDALTLFNEDDDLRERITATIEACQERLSACQAE